MKVHGNGNKTIRNSEDIKSRDEGNSLNYQGNGKISEKQYVRNDNNIEKLSNNRDKNRTFGMKDDMNYFADYDIEDREESYDSNESCSLQEEMINVMFYV